MEAAKLFTSRRAAMLQASSRQNIGRSISNVEVAQNCHLTEVVISPSGKSVVFGSLAVQPLLQKYFRSGLTQITSISIAISFRQEGRSRVVTSAGRDAVDVRASGAQWQLQGEMNLVSDQRRAR